MSLIKTLFCLILVILTGISTCSIIPMTVDWDDDTVEFYNDIRETTIDIIGFVPVIGDITSTLLDLFWPAAESEDKQLYGYIEKLIDQKILENNVDELKGMLGSIQEHMTHYQWYLDDDDFQNARTELDEAVSTSLDVKHYIKESEYYLELFPVMVPLSSIHLGNLLEKYLHGDDLLASNELSTSNVTQRILNETYFYYKDWFDSNYKDWYNWRDAQIEGKCTDDYMCNPYGCDYWVSWYVQDHKTGRKIGRNDIDTKYCDGYDRVVDGTKMAMMNEIQNYQINLISPTFHLHQYVPWIANTSYDTSSNTTKAIITESIPKTVSFGPYGEVKSPNGHYLAGYWDSGAAIIDKPGIVTSTSMNHGSFVDSIQLKYLTHDGGHIGGDGGGPYELLVNYDESWITSYYLEFGLNAVSTMNVGFNNGTLNKVTGRYNETRINCTMPGGDWALTSIAGVAGNPNGKEYVGIKGIRFDFTHKDYVLFV